jgi:hypothetical protein
MGHGADAVFAATMASGGTLTAAADLGRAWGRVYLQIPSGTSNTQYYIKGSGDNATFCRVYFDSLNSSTVGTNLYAIHSSLTGAIVPVPPGIQYLKVESTMLVADGATYKFICSDEA